MNYCSNCGTKIESKIKFCSNCGNTIQSKSNTQPELLATPSKVVLTENKTKKNFLLSLFNLVFKETEIKTLTKALYIVFFIDFLNYLITRNFGIIIDMEYAQNPGLYSLFFCINLLLTYFFVNVLSIQKNMPIFTLAWVIVLAGTFILGLETATELGRESLRATSGRATGLMILFDVYISTILEALLMIRIFTVLQAKKNSLS